MLDAPMLAERSPAEPLPDPAQDRFARHMARLEELAEIGMGIARSLAREAAAQAAAAEAAVRAGRMPAKGGKDLQLCFERLTRAIRLTMALDAKLLQDGRAFAAEAKAAREKRAYSAKRRRVDAVRDTIQRTIEAEARRSGADRDDVERLLDELDEHLEDAAEDFDFSDRPIGEIIAEIRQLMGLSPEPGPFEDDEGVVAETGESGALFAGRSEVTQDPLIPVNTGIQMTKLQSLQGDHPETSSHRIWTPVLTATRLSSAVTGVSGDLPDSSVEAPPDKPDDQPP